MTLTIGIQSLLEATKKTVKFRLEYWYPDNKNLHISVRVFYLMTIWLP